MGYFSHFVNGEGGLLQNKNARIVPGSGGLGVGFFLPPKRVHELLVCPTNCIETHDALEKERGEAGKIFSRACREEARSLSFSDDVEVCGEVEACISCGTCSESTML